MCVMCMNILSFCEIVYECAIFCSEVYESEIF